MVPEIFGKKQILYLFKYLWAGLSMWALPFRNYWLIIYKHKIYTKSRYDMQG